MVQGLSVHSKSFVNEICTGSVYLSAFPNNQASSVMLDEPMRRVSSTSIPSWLSTLLKTCIEGEQEMEVVSDGSRIPMRYQTYVDLTFIDTVENRIIRGRSNSRYLTLSYVWGGVKSLQLQSSNRADLEQVGALLKAEYYIARVIRDAIQLTREIGERFLWVDSLCIEQDNETQKDAQIQQMDVVYSHSILTIVALSSPNANMGLPGVREGTLLDGYYPITFDNQYWIAEIEQRWDRVDQFSPDLKYAYQTRAWTFQEHLLSRRCVFFTEMYPVYTCHGRSIPYKDQTETTHPGIETPPYMANLSLRLKVPNAHAPFRRWMIYGDLVREYSKRKLSFSQDALLAFSGMLQFLEPTFKSPFLYGLPENELDRALLFHVHNQSRRRLGFPTWSWAAWDSTISYFGQLPDAEKASRMINVLGHIRPLISKIVFIFRETREIKRSMAQYVDANTVHSPPMEVAMIAGPQTLLCFKSEMVPLSVAWPRFSRWHERVSCLAVAKNLPLYNATRIIPRNVRNANAYLFLNLEEENETGDISTLNIAKALGVKEQDLGLIALSVSIVPMQKMVNVMLVKKVGDIYERITIGQIDSSIWQLLQPLVTEIMLG
jgi:hypothetical protein